MIKSDRINFANPATSFTVGDLVIHVEGYTIVLVTDVSDDLFSGVCIWNEKPIRIGSYESRRWPSYYNKFYGKIELIQEK